MRSFIKKWKDYVLGKEAPGETLESPVVKGLIDCPDEAVCAYEWDGRLFRTKQEVEEAMVYAQKQKLHSMLLEYLRYGFHPSGYMYRYDLFRDVDYLTADRAAEFVMTNKEIIMEIIQFEEEIYDRTRN